MKGYFLVLVAIVFALGCARVSVQGSQVPIKLDITMRLDVYQHVQNDINAIEDLISGPKASPKSPDNQSLLDLVMGNAYAQGGLSPEVEQAAMSRKARVDELYALEAKGIVGENKSGLVEIRDSSAADSSVAGLIRDENNDRMVIYQAVAAGNNTAVEEVQKLYAKRLQSDAPSGTVIEVLNQASGSYQWQKK